MTVWRPITPRAQLLVIAGKIVLLLLIFALCVASVAQQRQQDKIDRAQHATQVAHNDAACAMRALTKTLISRTHAALERPSTRPEDRAGFEAAITAYTNLRNAQITSPRRGVNCRLVLKQP